MKGLLVILSTVALASCSPAPTLGLLGGLHGLGHGGHAVGLPGIVGGGHPGLGGCHSGGGGFAPGLPGIQHGGGGSLPGAVLGGAAGGVPGAILGGALGGAPGGFSGSLGGLAGGLLGGARPRGRTDRGYKQEGGVYPVGGGGLFQALGFLAQGLTDVVGNAGSILDDVVHLRIPAVLDDGFNAVISVGRGLGGIINALIPGLGSLLGNLVVSIGKILICLLGSPGLTGSLLGRTPGTLNSSHIEANEGVLYKLSLQDIGKDNPRDIPYICTPSYGRDWGCSYDGPYDRPGSIINFYKVKDAKRQALEFIDQYTNGQGIDGLTGSRRIVVERVITIATIVDKGADNWTDDDIADLTINIIIINGALGDSYQPGLGPKIVDEWIVTLKKNNKNKRFPDLSKYRTKIIVALKDASEDKWAGAFDQSKRKDWERIQNSRSDDTSNQSNNEQSNQDNSSSESNGNSKSDNNSQSNDNSSTNNSNTSSNNSNNSSNNSNSSSDKSDSESNKSDSSNNKSDSSNNKSDSSNNTSDSSNNKSDSSNNKSDSSNNKSDNSNDSNNASNDASASNQGSKGSSDNSGSDGFSDSSTYLNEKNASSKLNKASEEKSYSKSSTGSGKSQVNADGSSLSEYNFANDEASNSKKSSESIDNRASERTYKHTGDDDE